jgi:hypothetical protein
MDILQQPQNNVVNPSILAYIFIHNSINLPRITGLGDIGDIPRIQG